jgi:hypothetical protein
MPCWISFLVMGDGHGSLPFGSQPFSHQPPESGCQLHAALVPSGPHVLGLCPHPFIRFPHAAPFESCLSALGRDGSPSRPFAEVRTLPSGGLGEPRPTICLSLIHRASGPLLFSPLSPYHLAHAPPRVRAPPRVSVPHLPTCQLVNPPASRVWPTGPLVNGSTNVCRGSAAELMRQPPSRPSRARPR